MKFLSYKTVASLYYCSTNLISIDQSQQRRDKKNIYDNAMFEHVDN